MNLNKVMDKAFDLLEESLKNKQAISAAEGERLSAIAQEQEKTKRMGFSSQERIQHLLNQGLIDRQSLENEGILSKQEMVNSGLTERQGLENQGKLDERKMQNSGDLAVQDSKNKGSIAQTQYQSNATRELENLKADHQEAGDFRTVKEYNDEGSVTGERLINPRINQRIGGDYETGSSDEIKLEVSPTTTQLPVVNQTSLRSINGNINPTVASLTDRGISTNRHTIQRQEPLSARQMPVSQGSGQASKGKMNGPYIFHPEQFETLPSKIGRLGTAVKNAAYPNGTPKNPYPNGIANYVKNNGKRRSALDYDDKIGGR